MRLGRFGGLLVVAGCALLVVTALIAQAGGSVGANEGTLGGYVLSAALAAIALGAGWIALSGAAPFTGRFVRVGLALLGIGMLMTILTARVSASSMLVVVYLVGGLIAGIGTKTTGWALLSSSGRPHRGVLVFLAGLGLACVAGLLANAAVAAGPQGSLIAAASTGLALAGGAVMLGATAWLGSLTFRTEQQPAAIPD